MRRMNEMESTLRCREGLFDLMGCGTCQHVSCCSGIICPFEALQMDFFVPGSIPGQDVSLVADSDSQNQVDGFCIPIQSMEV